jgi:GrpB-like predicted nucleotidyltransferase (UPF0157 family)
LTPAGGNATLRKKKDDSDRRWLIFTETTALSIENTIELTPYTATWPSKFRREKAALSRLLASHHARIEHIGSTAVKGSVAKPIVDIAIMLDTVEAVPQLVQPLAGMSYEYMGEFGLAGRHFFVKGNPREINLHVVDSSTDHWRRWIRFRDILRKNAEVRRQYQELKIALAGQYHFDREKYTAGKSDFINATIDAHEPRKAR